MRLDGKVAVVTGSGRGIGAGIARALAEDGAKIVVCDLDAGPAKEVADEICEAGGDAISTIMDVTNREQVEEALAQALDAFGAVDILVNNAGLSLPAMIEKMTPEQWDQGTAVNMTGVFNCTQIIGRTFVDRGRKNPDALCNGKINYAAAKAGVLGITMSAAREWGRYGINVNCVAFGMVETRMTETIRTDPRFADQYKKQIVLGRYSTPADVAPAVVFFASDDANYVTGQILNVCGGADIHI